MTFPINANDQCRVERFAPQSVMLFLFLLLLLLLLPPPPLLRNNVLTVQVSVRHGHGGQAAGDTGIDPPQAGDTGIDPRFP